VRPNPDFGTLELRVPDAQTTLREAAAVAAVGHCLVAWLADRARAGEELPVDPGWRIEENRWSACRHGMEGELADLRTGERVPTRERLHTLLDELEPVAEALACSGELAGARELVQENGAMRQRAVAGAEGIAGLPAWLAGRFLEGV
jgi:carboxylate-amine ligase